jgi:hypothetical protein
MRWGVWREERQPQEARIGGTGTRSSDRSEPRSVARWVVAFARGLGGPYTRGPGLVAMRPWNLKDEGFKPEWAGWELLKNTKAGMFRRGWDAGDFSLHEKG